MKKIEDEMYSIGNAISILPAQRSVSVIERIKGLITEEFGQLSTPTVYGGNGGQECTINVEPNADGTGCPCLIMGWGQESACAYLPPAVARRLAQQLLESVGAEA